MTTFESKYFPHYSNGQHNIFKGDMNKQKNQHNWYWYDLEYNDALIDKF